MKMFQNKDWINLFGEILYMQYPDENPYYPSDRKKLQHIHDDKLCKILLDKESILPEIEAATDCQYWGKEPTEEQYLAVCNEFWWCTNI